MLRFRITRAAVATRPEGWHWTGQEWRAADACIVPLAHPALAHRMVSDGTSLAVVAREREPGEAPAPPGPPDRLPTEAYREVMASTSRPLDQTTLVIEPTRVLVQASSWCTAPMYLAAGAGALDGSWDVRDLREHTDASALADREIARLLTRRHRYGHETVWRGVHRLTERSIATWSGGRLVLRYPPAARHTRPRPLRPGADVLSAFEDVLARAVGRRSIGPEHTAIELSGGLDSANVAATLASCFPGAVAAAGLLIGGSFDAAQRRRRRMMMDAFAAPADFTVTMAEHLPFAPTGARATGQPVSPYAEPWVEAKAAMMAAMRAAGAQWSFGGTGGDELTSLRAFEAAAPTAPVRPTPWLGPRVAAAAGQTEEGIAPASVIHESTLLAFASRAPQFLAAGLWPVSPLADPEVIQFCEWLPLPWRQHKTLQRLRLARLGLPLAVSSDPRDDPRETLDVAIRTHVVPFLQDVLRRGGVLTDGGYVDGGALAAALPAAAQGGRFQSMDRGLFQIASLEYGLRTCSGRGV